MVGPFLPSISRAGCTSSQPRGAPAVNFRRAIYGVFFPHRRSIACVGRRQGINRNRNPHSFMERIMNAVQTPTVLNGLNVDDLQDLVAATRADAANAQTHWA